MIGIQPLEVASSFSSRPAPPPQLTLERALTSLVLHYLEPEALARSFQLSPPPEQGLSGALSIQHHDHLQGHHHRWEHTQARSARSGGGGQTPIFGIWTRLVGFLSLFVPVENRGLTVSSAISTPAIRSPFLFFSLHFSVHISVK